MRLYRLGYSAVIVPAMALVMALQGSLAFAQSASSASADTPQTRTAPTAPVGTGNEAIPAAVTTKPLESAPTTPSVPANAIDTNPSVSAAPIVFPTNAPAAPVAIGARTQMAEAAAPEPQVAPPANVPTDWESLLTKPGSYVWQPERAPEGQVLIVVSLTEQRAHVYRDGVRIAITTISSGSKGRETPTGSFEILQKKVMHRSNLYDDAPMPFMQRLTWDGIALHAGRLPGYPASHGCIRLPRKFAELLYGATNFGSRVLVADIDSDPTGILVHPGDTAPVDAVTGVPQGAYAQALGEATNRYAMPMLSAAALDSSKPLREQLSPGSPQAQISEQGNGVPAFAKPIWHGGDDPAKRKPQAPLFLLPQTAPTAIGTE